MKKLYSASEIAAMHLPDLPATKARVIDRATGEGWPYEEKKGLGGTRRMYEIPTRYLAERAMLNVRHATNAATEVALQYGPLSKTLRLEMQEVAFNENLDTNQLMERFKDRLPQPVVAEPGVAPGKVIATIAAGTKVDPAILERIIRIMDEIVVEQGREWVPERKAAFIAVLYDYLAKGADENDVKTLLRAIQ
jgi:hypothetical protein